MLLAVVLCGVVCDVADVVFGPWARMHWEELFNARAAVQLACGHWEAAPRLQYRDFCGGCTAEAVVAAPLFQWFGPRVFVWKFMLAGLHAGIVGLGMVVAMRAAGLVAALAFGLLMLGAPGFYRELTHTGWGNHAESMLFPLAAVCLMGGRQGGRVVRLARLFGAGLICGLGLWFCQTSAWAIPALVISAVWVGRAASPLFLFGLPVGFSPWWWFFGERPRAAETTVAWWSNLEIAPASALWEHLFGDYIRGGLWSELDYGPGVIGPSLWWVTLWIIATMGVGASWARWREARDAFAARTIAPLGVLTFLAVLAVRWDWWKWLPDVYVNEAFNLRYRAPLVPLLFLLASSAVPRLGRSGVFWVGALAVYGMVQRVTLWSTERPSSYLREVYQASGWPDRTVPSGEPRQQLVRKQGRPQDIEAALTFVDSHEDPFGACAVAHRFELGRRVGIARELDVEFGWSATADSVVRLQGPHEVRAWSDGYARSLIEEDGSHDPAVLGATLDRLDGIQSGLGLDVGAASGRRAAAGFDFREDAALRRSVDARVWHGVCEARGLDQMDKRTDHGERRPWALSDRPDLVEAAGLCADTDAFAFGVGVGIARFVGCSTSEVSERQLEGFDFVCAQRE